MLALRSKKIANCHSVLLSIIRCACEDGVGDEIRTFVEVKDGSRIRVGDFIAIIEYIVDTKKE